MDILSISQFGFSAYAGSPTPPKGAVVGWTSVSSTSGNRLASVPDASRAPEQLFNAYAFALPPGTAGQGLLLQSISNGKYVAAGQQTVDGESRTVFGADAETQAEAAHFGLFRLGANLAFLWQDPADAQWYGLINLAGPDDDAHGVLVASAVSYVAPYLLPWQAAQTNPNWTFTPPGGWNVGNGSDLSWVDFTCMPNTQMPFDFSRCRVRGTNLSDKTFGHAKFTGCDLSDTKIAPPLGAAADAWIDFTGATLNYPSLGPDWQFLNLTAAVINRFPAPPEPPPQINGNGAILNHTNMIRWNLAGADFTGASLCNANLTGSYLEGAKFHGAVLSPIEQSDTAAPANLAYCYLFDADLSNANAQGVSFAYAFLFGKAATLAGASLREADFSNAFLPEIDFSGIAEKDLVGATFDGACLAEASFQGTLLGRLNTRGFSFVGAALQGTDFTGSNLEGANLTNAAVAAESPPPSGAQLQITSKFALGSITVPIQPIIYTRQTTLAVTDSTTFCPSGTGPCADGKLAPSDPSHCPQTSWPTAISQPRPPTI
jgi:uncharacterized protein YjbI with pentapeptide repeats